MSRIDERLVEQGVIPSSESNLRDGQVIPADIHEDYKLITTAAAAGVEAGAPTVSDPVVKASELAAVVAGIDWLGPVLDTTIVDSAGAAAVVGNRYLINGVSLNDWTGKDYQVAECASLTPTVWTYELPVAGRGVWDLTTGDGYVCTGAATPWTKAFGREAAEIPYDPAGSTTPLVATDIGAALDELDLNAAWHTKEAALAGALIELPEGTDNGTNKVTMAAPAALGGDRTITVPDADVDLTDVAHTNRAILDTLVMSENVVTEVDMDDKPWALVMGTPAGDQTKVVSPMVLVDPNSPVTGEEELTLPLPTTYTGVLFIRNISATDGLIVDPLGSAWEVESKNGNATLVLVSNGTAWTSLGVLFDYTTYDSIDWEALFKAKESDFVAKATYDFGEDGGAVGTINLQWEDDDVVIPSDSMIKRTYLWIETAPVSAGGAGASTLAFQIEGANDVITQTAENDAIFTVSKATSGKQDGTVGNMEVLAGTVQMLIGGADLNAGKMHLYIEYRDV